MGLGSRIKLFLFSFFLLLPYFGSVSEYQNSYSTQTNAPGLLLLALHLHPMIPSGASVWV